MYVICIKIGNQFIHICSFFLLLFLHFLFNSNLLSLVSSYLPTFFCRQFNVFGTNIVYVTIEECKRILVFHFKKMDSKQATNEKIFSYFLFVVVVEHKRRNGIFFFFCFFISILYRI